VYLKALEIGEDGLIDMGLLRSLCIDGLPEAPEIRSVYWKVF
jgi:hypothetical protein